jgi:hypothetical protein
VADRARLVHARPRPLPRLRLPILSGWMLRTRSLSAASFRSITRSQKEVTALRVLSPSSTALIIAGSKWEMLQRVLRRVHPPPHRNGDTSLLIRYRYSLKQPCPVSTCVTLYVRGGPPPSSQSPQCGRTASTTLSPGAPVLVSSRERHTPSRACLAPVLTSAPARPLPPSGRPRVWR